MTEWSWIRVVPAGLISLVSLSASVRPAPVAARGAVVQQDETLEWMDNYDEALALAKQTGRPLFLEYRCSP